MYFTDPNTQASRLTTLSSGLKGIQKPLGCDLSNGNDAIVGGGTPIMKGSPLIFKYRRTPSGAVANTTLDMTPAMNVNYHIVSSGVAVINKMASGTSVSVSV